MSSVEYHMGGFIPSAPAQNKSREIDSAGNTVTTWDKNGVQLQRRALSASERTIADAADAASVRLANESTLRAKAQAALAANNAYIALASPTAAQTTAHCKTLSKECNALIRLVQGIFDADDA